MSKFPIAENSEPESLTVDQLTELFEGVLEQVEGDLISSSIMSALNRPELPQGLEALISWNEISIEGADGMEARWVDPEGPGDVTELTDIALAKYYGFLTRWRNYTRSEAARAKDILTICKKKLSVVEAALKIYFKETRQLPANRVDDHIKMDSRFTEMSISVLKASIYYSRCDTRDASYSTLLNSLSREQSRRAEGFKEEMTAESSSKWRRPLRPTDRP